MNNQKKFLIYPTLIIIIFFLIRLTNLTLQPIFCDEAIYINWAQKIGSNPKLNAFLPLVDGKTPLFMWITSLSLKIFKDPLFSGRIISVLAGFSSLAAAFFLGKEIFKTKTGIIFAILITFLPFTLFFDRMALVDSMLASFYLWSLVLALKISQKPKVKTAVLLGLSLGGGILTKTPGIFAFISLPFILITTNLKNFKKVALNLSLSAFIGLLIFNLLRISPYFENLSKRDNDYYFPIKHILENPTNPLIGNTKYLVEALSKFLTLPIFLITLFSILLVFYKKDRKLLTILLWSLIPIIPMLFLFKTFTSRYILFSTMPLIIILSWGITILIEKYQKVGKIIFGASLIPALIFDYYLLFNPTKAPLPKDDRKGYFEDWTAGYGIKEVASFLKEKAKKGNVLIVTEGAFGTLPDGIAIYTKGNSNIEIWHASSIIEPYIYDEAKTREVYFAVNKSRFVNNPNLELIKEYPKAKSLDEKKEQDALLLFKINP